MQQALIWGGNGDIGRATASHLRENGWQVFTTTHSSVENSNGAGEPIIQVDVGDDYAVQQAITALSREVDQIDLWVYAAGDITFTKVADLAPADWKRILDANLTGAYLTLHHSLPLLAPDAHVVFLGALSEKLVLPRLAAYAAAKTGLERFVEVLAKEERKRRFTLVRPGAVDTQFWQRGPARLPKQHLQPADVAQAILTAFQEDHSGQLDLIPEEQS